MKRPNITPGPWSWQPQGNRKHVLPRHYCMNSYTGSGLASIVVKSEDEVWPKSPDAQAIAAVPNLLEALEPFAAYFSGDLANVGGGTRVSPSFTVQQLKDARAALIEAGYTF